MCSYGNNAINAEAVNRNRINSRITISDQVENGGKENAVEDVQKVDSENRLQRILGSVYVNRNALRFGCMREGKWKTISSRDSTLNNVAFSLSAFSVRALCSRLSIEGVKRRQRQLWPNVWTEADFAPLFLSLPMLNRKIKTIKSEGGNENSGKLRRNFKYWSIRSGQNASILSRVESRLSPIENANWSVLLPIPARKRQHYGDSSRTHSRSRNRTKRHKFIPQNRNCFSLHIHFYAFSSSSQRFHLAVFISARRSAAPSLSFCFWILFFCCFCLPFLWQCLFWYYFRDLFRCFYLSFHPIQRKAI